MGKERSKEYREKIRQSLLLYHKKHQVSSETRLKLSKISKGRKVSEETRRKLSKANKGKSRPISLETRRKLSEAHKNYRPSIETRRKSSLALKGNSYTKGYRHTLEARQKISAASKGHVLSLEGRKKIALKLKGNKNSLGHHHSPETLLKMSSSQKGHPVRPSTREKLSQINQEKWALGEYKNIDLSKFFKNGAFFSNKNNRNMHYRSSYELRAYQLFELNDDILSYESEPFFIEYFLNGVKKHYHPDVLVIYRNDKKELIEIKPMSRLKETINIIKINAGQKYAHENNMVYTIMTEKELGINKKGKPVN